MQPGHSERDPENIVQKEILDFHFFPRSTFIAIDSWFLMIKNDATCHMWICLHSVLLKRHTKGMPEPTRSRTNLAIPALGCRTAVLASTLS